MQSPVASRRSSSHIELLIAPKCKFYCFCCLSFFFCSSSFSFGCCQKKINSDTFYTGIDKVGERVGLCQTLLPDCPACPAKLIKTNPFNGQKFAAAAAIISKIKALAAEGRKLFVANVVTIGARTLYKN